MHINKILDLVDYRTINVGEYQWECYGPNCTIADLLDSSGAIIGSMVYHQREVREITVDFSENIIYRWIDPQYVDSYVSEANSRNIGADIAFDNVSYVGANETDIVSMLQGKLESGPANGVEINDEEFDELLRTALPPTTVVEEPKPVSPNTNKKYRVRVTMDYELEVDSDDMNSASRTGRDFVEAMVSRYELRKDVVYIDRRPTSISVTEDLE